MSYDQNGNWIDDATAQQLYGNNNNNIGAGDPGFVDYTDPNSPFHDEALAWLAQNPGDFSRINQALNSETSGSGIDSTTGQPGYMLPDLGVSTPGHQPSTQQVNSVRAQYGLPPLAGTTYTPGATASRSGGMSGMSPLPPSVSSFFPSATGQTASPIMNGSILAPSMPAQTDQGMVNSLRPPPTGDVATMPGGEDAWKALQRLNQYQQRYQAYRDALSRPQSDIYFQGQG